MNQPNAAAKRVLAQYTKTVEDYDAFLKANLALIAEYEAWQEKKRLAIFTAQEKTEMLIDEGKIPTDIFLENASVEMRVKPDGTVRFFEKKLYGTAHLQAEEK